MLKFETNGPDIQVTATRPQKKRKGEHVRFLSPATLFCAHCGLRYEMNLPIPIDLFSSMSKTFEKSHRTCRLDKVRGEACCLCQSFNHPGQECPNLNYRGDYRAWMSGPDTGLSSMTLCRALAGLPVNDPAFPYDPEDFGRCYRLLKAIPGWRSRIGEMSRVPGWENLAPSWDGLEKLYEEELPTGQAPKLYAEMQRLMGDQR